MKKEIVTSTDTAAIAIWDSSLTDKLRKSDANGFSKKKAQAEKTLSFYSVGTGSDGQYLVFVFINENPSAPLSNYIRDPISVNQFHIPSGKVFIDGEEIFFNGLSDGHIDTKNKIDVELGDYRITAYRVEDLANLVESRFNETSTPEQRRAWRVGNALPLACITATIIMSVISVIIYAKMLSLQMAFIPLFFIAGLWYWQIKYRETNAYKSAKEIYRNAERHWPSIVIEMMKIT